MMMMGSGIGLLLVFVEEFISSLPTFNVPGECENRPTFDFAN
jgi:hypothetical protein